MILAIEIAIGWLLLSIVAAVIFHAIIGRYREDSQMGNHCIDIGCPRCGYGKCARGCGSAFKVDVSRISENALPCTGERCPECGTQMVYV